MNGPRLRLLGLVRRSPGSLATTTVLGLLQSATFVPVAFLLQRIFNEAIPAHDDAEIVALGAGIAALSVLGAAFGVAAQGAGSRMARRIVADVRRDLLRRLYAQPAAWHDGHDPGVLELTVIQHTERLGDLLAQLTAKALPSVVLAIALAAATLFLDPVLTVCVLVVVPLYGLVALALGGRSRRRYRDWLDSHVRFGVTTRIAMRTLRLAQIRGAETWELRRRDERIDDNAMASRRFDDARARYEGAQLAVTGIGGSIPLIVGGLAVSDGRISIGTLLAFYSLGLMTLRATGAAVAGFANAAVGSEALAAVEAITAQDPPAPRGGFTPAPLMGAVAFEAVDFDYDGSPVLSDVTFSVEPGEHVALMGPSGAGKTTIASLLLGLYAPQHGTVRVDGHPLEELDLAGMRRQTGVVMQNTVVFPGTIRENIAYGRAGSVEAAARAAGLDASGFSGGLEHQVGEDGELLSGGQRQRIGIARALIGDPRLLILDEPTLHLDAVSVERVLLTLDALECTILTITHDPEVAARADRSVRLRDGRVSRSPAVR